MICSFIFLICVDKQGPTYKQTKEKKADTKVKVKIKVFDMYLQILFTYNVLEAKKIVSVGKRNSFEIF